MEVKAPARSNDDEKKLYVTRKEWGGGVRSELKKKKKVGMEWLNKFI